MNVGKYRNWCFTWNNYTEIDEWVLYELVNQGTLKFVAYGKEIAPTTNTPHLQGFLGFKNQVRFNTVKELLPTCHLEAMRGSIEDNEYYCSKDDEDLTIWGDLPAKNNQGRSSKERWQEVVACCMDNNIDEISEIAPDVYIRHYVTLKKIAFDHQKPMDNLRCRCGVWLWGDHHTGKSWTARTLGNYYTKDLTQWWDGYQGQDVVVIDDIDPSHEHLKHLLKIWLDIYPFQAQWKGGYMTIRPKIVVLTSNFQIPEIFKDWRDVHALQDRFGDRIFQFFPNQQNELPCFLPL